MGGTIGPRFSAQYVISVTPSDVGRRVTLRRRLADGLHSDVVGELLAWESGRLTVRRRDGSEITLAEADLVAGRVVPAAPPRRRPGQGGGRPDSGA